MEDRAQLCRISDPEQTAPFVMVYNDRREDHLFLYRMDDGLYQVPEEKVVIDVENFLRNDRTHDPQKFHHFWAKKTKQNAAILRQHYHSFLESRQQARRAQRTERTARISKKRQVD